jgi:hypothetical protein
MHTKFWSENMKRRSYLADPDTDERMMLNVTGSEDVIWIRLGSDGRLL